jgi:hypothetical protein
LVDANSQNLADSLAIAIIEEIVLRPPVSADGQPLLCSTLGEANYKLAQVQRLFAFPAVLQTAANERKSFPEVGV